MNRGEKKCLNKRVKHESWRCSAVISACQVSQCFTGRFRHRIYCPSAPARLTEFDKEHACCGHGALGVGGHTLEVACVSCVQVADAEAWSVRHGSVRDPSWLRHHWSVVLQPTHSGRRVASHKTVKLGCLAQRCGDVVHGSFKADEERPWKTETHRRDEGRRHNGDAE